MHRHLKDVIGAVRQANGECVVLMGAGCSLSAGIPLAGTLVQEIKNQHPEAYDRARQAANRSPNYNELMEQLSLSERQRLLSGYIEKSKINWAHLALAQLFANQKIDRVLTVNFDPLLIKACSLVNFYPAIYDLASASEFRSHRVAPKSLFYLNGQHTGFVILNAEDELLRHKEKLRSIVRETGIRRTWLVVGYSGEADPLLEVLKEHECFDGDLYWLGHSTEPSSHLVQSGLFSRGRHAFYVGGQDADKCLTEIAQKLDSFPPSLLISPEKHLQEAIALINFETGGDAAVSMRDSFSKKIQSLIDTPSVKHGESQVRKAEEWLLAGNYQRVIDDFSATQDPQIKVMRAWAFLSQGDEHASDAAESATSDLTKSRQLWAAAVERYKKALEIKPNMHEAANNWGRALAAEARAVKDHDLAAARALWQAAGDQYKRALAIKPDMHWAACNWGIALAAEARAVKDHDLAAARALWKAAGDQYKRALEIKPDMHEAACNLGIALAAEAWAVKDHDLAAARALWQAAGEQYARALQIKPDMHEAACNWGSALDDEAQAVNDQDPAAARSLWKAADEQYARALQIKPDMHEAAKNWGSTLARQYDAFIKAQGSVGASEVLESAIKLLESHSAKYPESIPHLAYNLACAYALAGRNADALKQLEISSRNGLLPPHWREDEDLAGLRLTAEYSEWAEAQHAYDLHQ